MVGAQGLEPRTSCVSRTFRASTASMWSIVLCGMYRLGASASAQNRWPKRQFPTHLLAHILRFRGNLANAACEPRIAKYPVFRQIRQAMAHLK